MSLLETVRGWFGAREAPEGASFADDGTTRYNLPFDSGTPVGYEKPQYYNQTGEESRQLRIESARNGYVRRAIEITVDHVVGEDGVQITFKNPEIQMAWDEWAMEVDYASTMSLRALERLAVRNFMRDGEVILQRRTRRNRGLRFEPRDSRELERGRFSEGIVGGIELNPTTFQPIRYRFLDYSTVMDVHLKAENVDARNIIHVYEKEYARQQRGLSPLLGAKEPLKWLERYEYYLMYNAQVTAAEPGHYELPDKYLLEDDESLPDDEMERMIHLEPGQRRALPEGTRFYPHELGKSFDGGNYKEYRKGMLTHAAASVGISYFTLASDLEGANYSSLRQGQQDDDRHYGRIQRLLGELLDKIIAMWFAANPNLPMDREYEYAYRGTDYIDPVKEAMSERVRIENRTTSRSQVIRARGGDPDKLFLEIRQEEETLGKMGLIPNPASRTNGNNGSSNGSASEESR